jgi:hypothetical protein
MGCASAPARHFVPLDNCVPSLTEADVFSCFNAATGEASDLLWVNSHDLVCFHGPEFKAHEEVCHQGE